MYIQNIAIEHKPLILGESLENFIDSLHIPASIKDAKTGKYQIVNTSESERYALKPEEQIGLTVREIGKLAKLSDLVINKILNQDQSIATQITSNSLRKMHFLVNPGFVMIDQSFKRPVFNSNGEIVAILGYAQDITTYCNLLLLFSLYEQYYEKGEAIQRFLSYLKIDTIFYKNPTRKELLTLLAMRENSTSKEVGNHLEISSRTVEEYKARLRMKLKTISLDELAILLIKRNEYETLNS